jgi:hypothetical protein
MSESKKLVSSGLSAALFLLASCSAPVPGATPENKAAQEERAAQEEKEAKDEKAAWLIRRTQDGVKSRLRDPDSAKFSDVHTADFKGNMVVCGHVNAANGFGGKTGLQKFVGVGDTVFLEEEGSDAVNEAWINMGC